MEKEMADLLIELNRQRDHNDLMHDKVSHLEMSLEHSKVLSIPIKNIQLLFEHFCSETILFMYNELVILHCIIEHILLA